MYQQHSTPKRLLCLEEERNIMRCNVFYIGKFSCAVSANREAGSGSEVASTISDPSIFFSVLKTPCLRQASLINL